MAEQKKTKKKESKNELFRDFGEMNSAKELNLCMDGFREEGDTDSLIACAKENGFTEKDVTDWIKERETHLDAEFCNPITAASAKLNLEAKNDVEKQAAELLSSELDDLDLAIGIRKKGKRLKDAFGKVEDYAKNHKNGNKAIVSDDKALEIMKKYYKEG